MNSYLAMMRFALYQVFRGRSVGNADARSSISGRRLVSHHMGRWKQQSASSGTFIGS